MDLKSSLKKSGFIRGARQDYKSILQGIKNTSNRSKIKVYFKQNNTKKLQLGSHSTVIPGWLSSDIIPIGKDCIYLDATKKFPFKNNQWDYIYCEHMIEHISWEEGCNMLSESFRILKPGGKIRLATPNLEVFTDMYVNGSDGISKEYMIWMTDRFMKGVDIYKPIFVLNTIFRNWYHKFLYDEELLTVALNKAGFVDVKRVEYGQSNDENYKNLEQHGKNMGKVDMAKFESLIGEAVKPIHK
jgi:predicted SAM-dependent methyltransferase